LLNIKISHSISQAAKFFDLNIKLISVVYVMDGAEEALGLQKRIRKSPEPGTKNPVMLGALISHLYTQRQDILALMKT